MSNYTITIPADLREGFTPADIREIAACVVPHPEGDPDDRRMSRQIKRVLGWIADEIERQAPRAEGWYHVVYKDGRGGRIYYWDGQWRKGPGVEDALYAEDSDFLAVQPVTIGRADS